jgi:hypothetical protein
VGCNLHNRSFRKEIVDQAGNRLHTSKAIVVATLGKQ